jgi:hypothetical protein
VPRGRRRRVAGREAWHVVKAFVVLAEGYAPSDELAAEIQGFVRHHLAAYAYPRRSAFVDDLPKTLAGKIRRIELREARREGSAQAASAPTSPPWATSGLVCVMGRPGFFGGTGRCDATQEPPSWQASRACPAPQRRA